MQQDTFAVVISVLGTILTAATVAASVAQYRAADLQAQAAQIALMPQVEVRSVIEKIDSDKYTDRRIEISSDGGPVYNFQVDHLSWAEFRDGGKVVLEEPLVGYYFASYPTGHVRGTLYTITGFRNNQRFFDFLEWSRSALPGGIEVGQPVTVLRIGYVDALKRSNTEYVKVTGGRALYLSIEEGERIWDTQSRKRAGVPSADVDALAKPETGRKWVQGWAAKLKAMGIRG